jgi:chromosome partitioning protein
MQGIKAIQDIISHVREGMGNPDLKLRGVLPTFFDPESVFAPQTLADVRALLPGQVFDTVIPYDPAVADAPHLGKGVVDYASNSPSAVAYRSLADELLT